MQAILDLERQRKAYAEAVDEAERLLKESRRMHRQLVVADTRLKRHQVTLRLLDPLSSRDLILFFDGELDQFQKGRG